MPAKNHTVPLPPLSVEEVKLAGEMRKDIGMLAGEIGERNVQCPDKLREAVGFISASLSEVGYQVRQQDYPAGGCTCSNLDVEIPGTTRPDEIVVIGAHYDTVPGCPGANDNTSGVASVLALARRFHAKTPARSLRFVLFANEEPPFFQTEQMGSRVYARACRKRNDDITAMFSLETMGCYSDERGSQQYPPPANWLYPDTGNFIAFVANMHCRDLVKTAVESFRRHTSFPSEGAALPGGITGVGWSDHWSFWQEGYKALMVTDTAPFRYRYYHTPEDTPEKIDYDRLARVVRGLEKVVEELAETG